MLRYRHLRQTRVGASCARLHLHAKGSQPPSPDSLRCQMRSHVRHMTGTASHFLRGGGTAMALLRAGGRVHHRSRVTGDKKLLDARDRRRRALATASSRAGRSRASIVRRQGLASSPVAKPTFQSLDPNSKAMYRRGELVIAWRVESRVES